VSGPAPHPLEAALHEAELTLTAAPDDPERRFERACLLDALGRAEARDAYIEVLAQAPTHFGALANLGALLLKTGYRSAARTVYEQAVAHHPQSPAAHVNLANVLAASEEPAEARRRFEAALALDAGFVEAHKGLADLLSSEGDDAAARPHREIAFKDRPVMVLPYRGTGRPVRLLVVASTHGASVPIAHHLDDRVFQTTVVYVEAFEAAGALPSHDLVFNAIGDADLCGPALGLAERLLAKTSAPTINRPARVMPTGRAENARRLAALPGVVTPWMAAIPRERLIGKGAEGALAELGLGFPVLLRAPGFHAGRFFERVDGPEDLAAAVERIPGEELMALQFLDAKSADGKIRKYRAMMIEGRLYPLHAAISHHWKIHYFSAEMAENPEHRAEDEAFLADMAGALGPKAMAALEAIRDALGLDYAGADFSLSPEGEIILFEANATMVVNPPDPDPRWDYRRPYVQKVLDSVQRLLREGAVSSRSVQDAV
jgi:hypothetical protein